MSDLGALSSYALASQTAQISMVKASADAQAQVVNMLLENSEQLKVAASSTHGNFCDITV